MLLTAKAGLAPDLAAFLIKIDEDLRKTWFKDAIVDIDIYL
jgi:hypothetical protein